MKTRSEQIGSNWMSLLLVALCACMKSNEGSAGSETHFLSSCSAKCPAPYSCSCGVCTLPCTSDSVCSAEFRGATCSARSEESCRAAPSVCDVECGTDAECGGLGEEFVCRAGECRQDERDAPMSGVTGEPRRVPAPDDSMAFKQVALGRTHGCALRNDGRVYCWGDNFFGQLGTPPPPMDWERGDARVIERLRDVRELYSGTSSSCSIDASGVTSCWGEIFVKQVGADGAYENAPSVRAWPLEDLDGIVEMSIGDAFHCARLDNTDVRCWGLNHLGQLGDGTREGRAGPESASARTLSAMTGATRIASGGDHSCGLDDEGKVWCWGGDLLNGQFQPTPSDQPSATPIDIDDVAEVDVGANHACVLQRSGRVYCWGDNSLSQLGNESTPSSMVPMAVLEISEAVDIAVGGNKSCALLSSGQLSCWGENLDDWLGTGQGWGWRQTPALVLGLDDAYAIDVGEQTICAISRSRGLLCWGSNNHMQVGDGTSELRNRPVPVLVVD